MRDQNPITRYHTRPLPLAILGYSRNSFLLLPRPLPVSLWGGLEACTVSIKANDQSIFTRKNLQNAGLIQFTGETVLTVTRKIVTFKPSCSFNVFRTNVFIKFTNIFKYKALHCPPHHHEDVLTARNLFTLYLNISPISYLS